MATQMTISVHDSPYTTTYHLLQPLGTWLHPSHHLDLLPLDPATLCIFCLGHSSYWQAFSPESQWPYCTTLIFCFSQVMVLLLAGHHLVRMESSLEATVTLSGSVPQFQPPQAAPLPWPLQFAHFLLHALAIAQAIRASSVMAICNGSYMPHWYHI